MNGIFAAKTIQTSETFLTCELTVNNPAKAQFMECDLDTSIPDWIVDHPETTSIFAKLGLDTSCGGKSLEYVALQAGLNPTDVLQQLRDKVAQNRCSKSEP